MADNYEIILWKEMMMKFYMHAGSLNHGCEAIVRSTAKMTDESIILYSEHPEEDHFVGLDDICEVKKQGGKRKKYNPIFILCKVVEVLFKNSSLKHWYTYKNVICSAKSDELYLSIGGDNYCYGANPYLIYINKALNKRGARTGLWGCSIEPDVLKDPQIIEDMKRYSFISARETITYNALKEVGLNNIHLYPDPAFSLEVVECELPKVFSSSDVVGINLSPLIQKLGESGKLVLENYIELIKYILNNTDMSIALIPHVCRPGNDDRESMKALASYFPKEKRIVLVNEKGTMDCRELKYVISKCKYMVTARTHASIAAYSTCVPTLVVGYSVKARGIARDLFGTDENYVVDVHSMSDPIILKNSFRFFIDNEQLVTEHLRLIMQDYISKATSAYVLLQK